MEVDIRLPSMIADRRKVLSLEASFICPHFYLALCRKRLHCGLSRGRPPRQSSLQRAGAKSWCSAKQSAVNIFWPQIWQKPQKSAPFLTHRDPIICPFQILLDLFDVLESSRFKLQVHSSEADGHIPLVSSMVNMHHIGLLLCQKVQQFGK